ncbi:2-dehydropantoate 2-reductase [Halosimplex carlsbadense 2-9-1]|uniref:2-dehydropantoate 2-reductase n=1 Tax=Halosimplex carlsbadense 2-9-1 TaxID=797114 RepID=M0CWL9_9EURY|nr:ketopantoate reductase family protein [Halosimplex carlsbadense]ELZ26847.1 2-dehydropantoate 2-reductase [Halosimplex carlsbadense 2-9-1]
MRVLVFGAGSLGSLLGGLLARAHDVTLVGRDPHVERVRAEGLRVTGEYTAHVEPAATTAVPAERFDLALVAVKAFDTPAAAAALDAADPDAVLSVQNGLDNERTLASALDAEVLAGTSTYGARLTEPGTVDCTGRGDVALGPPDGGESAVAESVGAALRAADIETTVAADMPRRCWEKLAVNAGINAVTALARVENGALVDGAAGEPARRAAAEVARVARERGIELSDDAAVGAVERVATATSANRSSMLQDVEAGERTEIDAISGAVVDRADAAVPVNETLAALIRGWERERGLR